MKHSNALQRQSVIHSKSTATSELVELLGETRKAEAKSYSYKRTTKNSESLTVCVNRVELLGKTQKAKAKGYHWRSYH